MADITLDELRAYLETIGDNFEDDGDTFDSRRSRRTNIRETLPGHPTSPLDTLLPLNPKVGGKRRQTIDFVQSLAKGGMGEIFVARQHPIGRNVAVKRLKDNKRSERHKRLLLEEGWITGRLQHPNIVPVYTLGNDDQDQPAIVMKLVEGVTLAELLADPDKLPEAFAAETPIESYIQILIQVCNALSYTHDEGFIHRDIKPSNIMVGHYGEVYLLDWGIAMQVGSQAEPLSTDGPGSRAAEGTPAYMAPEMAAPSFAPLSRRTDIFLLGASLHQILTGEFLNDGETYFQVLTDAYSCERPQYGGDVPEELARIATKALQRQPTDRYETVAEFRKALRDFLDSQASWRLAEVARLKLTELEHKILRDEQVSRSEVYPVFGACRLGFEQALEVHPENDEACQGLRRAVELMLEWELRNRGATNAETLLNSLPEPNPDLKARVQRALEHTEREHQESLLTRMSPDGVLAVDHTGTIVYANDQVTEIFGWTPQELQNQKIELLIPESKRKTHIGYRKSYQHSPSSRSMNAGLKLDGLHKDGSLVAVNIGLAPVSSGEKKMTIASVRKAPQSAATDKDCISDVPVGLLDVLSIPLFVMQRERMLWANQAFEQLLGQDGGRLITPRSLDHYFPDDVCRFPGLDAVEAAKEAQLRDVRTKRLDGRKLLLDLRFIQRPCDRFKGALLVEARHPDG